MRDSGDPIAFPPNFPPKSGWDKFFIGVRWLGPDLSFFQDFQERQELRSESLMSVWHDDKLRRLAIEFGISLKRHLHWKSIYFLPDDTLAAVLHGPKFEQIGGDQDAKDAVEEFQERIGLSAPISFWEDRLGTSLLLVMNDVKDRLQT